MISSAPYVILADERERGAAGERSRDSQTGYTSPVTTEREQPGFVRPPREERVTSVALVPLLLGTHNEKEELKQNPGDQGIEKYSTF